MSSVINSPMSPPLPILSYSATFYYCFMIKNKSNKVTIDYIRILTTRVILIKSYGMKTGILAGTSLGWALEAGVKSIPTFNCSFKKK